MIEQAKDFRDESEALFQILDPLVESEFNRKTLFKSWTLNDLLGHLHVWNWAANASLTDEPAFLKFMQELSARPGATLNELEREHTGGLSGRALLSRWRDYFLEVSEHFYKADPKLRLQWAGPTMSARSSITARLMETWSHGQAVYDVLGIERVNTDRVKNIAILGVNTFGFTYANRGQQPPGPIPHVRLTAPSGEIWNLTEPNETDRVEGDAVEFCQVVTQCRALGDTNLKLIGSVANNWMAIAQCFAGPPETPPAPGHRHRE